MESLPNNSEKALANQRPMSERKVEKIEGVNAVHKPTFFKMVRDSFIPKDVDNAGSYILSEMIVPGIRDGVFDIIMGIFDYWRSGVGGYSRRSTGRFSNNPGPRTQATRTDYNRGSRFSSRDYDRPVMEASSYDDIFLPDGVDRDGRSISGVVKAQKVIAQLEDDLREYGVARLSDMFSYCGITPEHTDCNFGWVNLDRAGCKPVRGGAVLILPKALQIMD